MGTNIEELARKIRVDCLRMRHKSGTSHVGSDLSCADILAVLYGEVLKPEDRFVMSKGHASATLYAALAETGRISKSCLDSFCNNGSALMGHVSHYVPEVEASTGSLGHGLPIGCGMAMAAKGRVYVLLSDGDLNEGSTWEAVMFAGHRRLSNLVAVVDYNRLQALGTSHSIIDLNTLSDKLSSFWWGVQVVDGHSCHYLSNAIGRASNGRPRCVIAYTTKGRGVSFMENRTEWHYKSPSATELEQAVKELK